MTMDAQRIRWTERPKSYKRDVHRVAFHPRVVNRGPDVGPAVFAKEVTEGIKLGPMSATYVSQITCPSICAFRGGGCYAEHGPLAMVTTKRLNKRALNNTAIEVAHQEAAAVDRLTGTRDLRLHVVGDCPTTEAAQIVAAAAERYIGRGLVCGLIVSVWTYTHAWRIVPRSAWGGISVLASCETTEHVAQARARGYATALVVNAHSERALHDGVLPCPEQTTPTVQCATCRLCADDGRLRDAGISVGFALHGDRAGLAKSRLALEQVR